LVRLPIDTFLKKALYDGLDHLKNSSIRGLRGYLSKGICRFSLKKLK
jgi:hypothetical protein